jgi:tetratricopeptide (TPR) repeat protein
MQRITRYLSILALALPALAANATAESLDQDLLQLQHQWSHVRYQLPEKQQDDAFSETEKQADALIVKYPNRAEPLVWKAIVISTHAGVKGGLGALGMVREARDLLEQAEKIDADTLDGSIYTSLGSLYYQVPGWPLAFGDDKKAKQFLTQALAINPEGIDANYFYGDFLYRQGDSKGALAALDKALHAPARPNRSVADEGRRKEAQTLIDKIKAES